MGKVGVVIAAAGSGSRMGKNENKVFLDLLGIPVLIRSLQKFVDLEWVNEIVVVCRQEDMEQIETLLMAWKISKIKALVIGGKTRQESVYRGLKSLGNDCQWVLIHDAARPLVEKSVLDATFKAVKTSLAVGVGVPVKDTIKQVDEDLLIKGTPERRHLWAIQTPQAFSYPLIIDAYAKAEKHDWQVTDDCQLVEKLGLPVKMIPGSYTNIKLTTPEDLLFGTTILKEKEEGSGNPKMRVGMGFDVHKLEVGLPLVLGGVTIEHPYGLKGHSDADVVTHALMDALLGAAGLGDIGTHFPDTDPKYFGISSVLLLGKVVNKLTKLSYSINNVDITIAAERPKLAPYIEEMKTALATVLAVPRDNINVKATTTEKLGFTGREEGIATYAVATLVQAD